MAVGSTAIAYDTTGNPTTYNGYDLTWHGRELKKMIRNGGQSILEFRYNADGIRTNKIVDGVNHVYTLNGTQIVSEAWGMNLLIYLYDESGSPIGLQYRTSSYYSAIFDTFYFEKNLQGDIVAVYNDDGDKIGSYIYDVWGNFTVSVDSSNSTLENKIVRTLNPFRYRGYYYDTETGLYYLQSRYYIPQWGRFLNADEYLSTGTGLLSYNTYAYCNNNPVMHTDTTGTWPRWITAAVTVAAAVVTVVALATGNLAVAAVAAKVTIAAGATYIAQTAHYNRNALNNTNYTEQELIDQGYEKEPNSADKFHQNNQVDNERNRKYVIGDWFSSEIVYYSDGTINSTPEDEGTFNVYSGGCPFLNIVVHGVFDVAPYMLWGNSEDDSTTIIDRFIVIWEE